MLWNFLGFKFGLIYWLPKLQLYFILSRNLNSSIHIKKYGSYFLSRDGVGLKWCPVLKVWEKLQDKHSKVMQNSYR